MCACVCEFLFVWRYISKHSLYIRYILPLRFYVPKNGIFVSYRKKSVNQYHKIHKAFHKAPYLAPLLCSIVCNDYKCDSDSQSTLHVPVWPFYSSVQSTMDLALISLPMTCSSPLISKENLTQFFIPSQLH